MNPITVAELASIRADVAAAACDTPCTIQRKTITRDPYGSETEVWATISPTGLLAGMKTPSAGQMQNYAYIIGDLAAWQVQLPYGQSVQRLDHLIIGGDTMTVQVDLSPQSYNALTTVLATEIKE